ncbi:MAG: terminase family protein [Muribaculaceae bacterium]|nr:terminase family protein [Muribaculaceae bacterium]
MIKSNRKVNTNFYNHATFVKKNHYICKKNFSRVSSASNTGRVPSGATTGTKKATAVNRAVAPATAIGATHKAQTAKNGLDIISAQQIAILRKADEQKPNPYNIIAQKGGQELFLSTKADITIFGGSRGGSKSFSILMDALNDIYNPNFHALIMRNEKSDLDAIIETSYQLYKQFGDYNRSKDDMTWNFHAGGFLRFGYYADDIKDFKIRWQGKDFAYIAIDEITHMPYNKFKYIITDNRNAFFIRNRVYGTCNPDPESWVARFIDWWIDEDGYPIPERNGRLRYCFMDGDDPTSITWGDTREEVYQKCRVTIDRYWREDMAQYGRPQDLFIKSVCFIEGKVTENRQLMRSDPTYLANLANQDEAQRARDLDGNWKYREVGTALLKLADMERWFNNDRQSMDNQPYASCDVALDGGDNLVLCLWKGNRRHLYDIFTSKLDSVRTPQAVAAKLDEWGVPQRNFTYDLSGLGQLFKGHFPDAVPFTNQGNIPPNEKYVYNDFKSKAAYLFTQAIKADEFSIEPVLLERKFSGHGYSKRTLREILINEKNALRRDETRTDHGFTLPKKAVMKKLVGHSPDFIEAMLMVMIFDIKQMKKRHGLGFL